EKERERNIISEQITWYQLEVDQIIRAKAGEDIQLTDGRLIPNAELTIPGAAPRSYAFCSDTRYEPDICSIINGVDLLYHESTFLHQDLTKAEKTMHSTAQEAAQIAKKAEVGKLILGHFSARYDDISVFEKEARQTFLESYAPEDGDIFEVYFNE
ncbi:MAG: ribonuclease Z, partial [Bacteroidota bacterium]